MALRIYRLRKKSTLSIAAGLLHSLCTTKLRSSVVGKRACWQTRGKQMHSTPLKYFNCDQTVTKLMSS